MVYSQINSHPIATTSTTYNFIAKNNQTSKLQTPASHESNQQSIHSAQSSSTKTTITNQPSTTHLIKYENVIYKLTLSTDGNKRRWIYVTPLLHNHHNETKGNDVSGHTGNKRTVMKVSNATIPITLSTVPHHANNLYKKFNHNNRSNIKHDNDDDDDDNGNDIQNGNVSKRLFNTRQHTSDNQKLDVEEKLSSIELMKKATIRKNIQQSSSNRITNKFNDEFIKHIDESRRRHKGEEKSSAQNDKNGKSSILHRRRRPEYTFDKNVFPNDGVVNKNRLPPIIKNDFVKNVPNGNDLTTHQRYATPTTQSSALIPFSSPYHQLETNFPQSEYYRLIENKQRKYILRSNPFHSGTIAGRYGFWDGLNKSLDPVLLQLMFTHKSILPQPHFWGIRGYGLYSFAAGNDLHNNLPNGRYKVERDFDN